MPANMLARGAKPLKMNFLGINTQFIALERHVGKIDLLRQEMCHESRITTVRNFEDLPHMSTPHYWLTLSEMNETSQRALSKGATNKEIEIMSLKQ